MAGTEWDVPSLPGARLQTLRARLRSGGRYKYMVPCRQGTFAVHRADMCEPLVSHRPPDIGHSLQ